MPTTDTGRITIVRKQNNDRMTAIPAMHSILKFARPVNCACLVVSPGRNLKGAAIIVAKSGTRNRIVERGRPSKAKPQARIPGIKIRSGIDVASLAT